MLGYQKIGVSEIAGIMLFLLFTAYGGWLPALLCSVLFWLLYRSFKFAFMY